MLKVMVAEDEILERKALNFLCKNFFENELEIICEATNGKDALEKAIQYKPDIILMDINMPFMDGLKASMEIKKRLEKQIEFIILTAYGYFEYAKEAIKLGINDYLLKPVSNEEFCESMNKVILKIKSKKEKEKQYENLEERQKKLLPLLEKEIIMKMIYGVDDPKVEYTEYLKMLEKNNKDFMCIIIKTDNIKKINNDIFQKIKNKINFYIFNFFGTVYTDEMIFLIFDKNLKKLSESKKIELMKKDLKKYFEDKFLIKPVFGESSVYSDPKNLHKSYEESRNNIKDNKNLSKKTKTFDTYELERELFKKIINEDLNGTIFVFDKLFNYLLNKKYDISIIKKQLNEFLYMLNREIIEFWGEEFDSFKLNKIQKLIEDLNDITKLQNCIKKTINEIILGINNHKKDKNVMIIEEVKQYINKNFKNNISLEEAAEKIGLSSYYLSKLFKKTEKMNFKDYLIKIRMEKAKKMLRKGNFSIKEIAFELGYSDPNYFSRAFKKYVGRSATEYSKL